MAHIFSHFITTGIQRSVQIFCIGIVFLLLPINVHAAVVINELYPKPSDEQSEWIELYNTGSESVSLNLWKLENTTGEKKTFIINASAIIQAHAFLVFSKSQTGITMGNDGDTIKLIDQNNTTIDSQSFLGILGYNTSIGRTADGAGVWSTCTTSTPETKNSCPEPTTTPTPLASDTPTPTVTPLSSPTPIVPIDTPTPIVEIVYITQIPTPTPTPSGNELFTVHISKTVMIQALIVVVAWILLAIIAAKKRHYKKQVKKTMQHKEPDSLT